MNTIEELHKIHAERKQAAVDRAEAEKNKNPIHRIAQTAAARHEAETQRIEAEKNRIQAEAEEAARAAAAKPLAKLAAEHDANQQKLNQLTELTTRRDILVDQIKVARISLGQQSELAGQIELFWESQFGQRHNGDERLNPNPHVFFEIVANGQSRLTALFVLPRLKAWIEKREAELANVEAQIAAFDTKSK